MVQIILTNLRVKPWIREERGFEGLGQAIPLLAEGPSWPSLSTWLPERPRPPAPLLPAGRHLP